MPRFVAPDGVELHYAVRGNGPPLLCLAGLTRNSTDFDYVAPFLDDVQMICLDYRGRGLSEWGDPTSYTIPTEAGDALALLDHLGIGKAAILGTSRGGLIAMGLAATVPDRLLGVFLNDIGPDIAPNGLAAIMGYLGRAPKERTLAEAAAMRATLLTGFANVPASRWFEEVSRHYRQTAEGLAITYDPALRRAVETASTQPAPDLWPLFDALAAVPLGLVRGANSDLLTSETANEMHRRRPDMLFAEIADRGHVPFLDEPAAVALLRRWVESL